MEEGRIKRLKARIRHDNLAPLKTQFRCAILVQIPQNSLQKSANLEIDVTSATICESISKKAREKISQPSMESVQCGRSVANAMLDGNVALCRVIVGRLSARMADLNLS